MAGEGKGQVQTNEIMNKGREATDAVKGMFGSAGEQAGVKKDETVSYLGQQTNNIGNFLLEKKDQTTSYFGGKAEVVKQKGTETAQTARDTTEAGKKQTGSYLQQAGDTVKNAAQGTADAVSNAAQGTADAVKNTVGLGGKKDNTTAGEQVSAKKDETVSYLGEQKNNIGNFLLEKKDQTTNYFGGKTEVAKQKGTETAQAARDTTDAGKKQTGSYLQQAGDAAKNAAQGTADAVTYTAQGTADAVKNTLGMGGNKDNTTAGK